MSVIALVVGPLGAGKSGFATSLAVARARKHHAILASNILLTPPDGLEFVHLPLAPTGLDVPAILALRTRALAEGRRVVVLIDEVGIVMDNRFWAAAPAIVKWFFKHSRKLHIDVYATTHDPEEVEVSFRRLVMFTYQLRRIPGGGEDGDERPPWALVVKRWEGVSVGKQGKRLGWAFLRRWRPEWQSWFDSDEIVEVPAEFLVPAGRRGAAR